MSIEEVGAVSNEPSQTTNNAVSEVVNDNVQDNSSNMQADLGMGEQTAKGINEPSQQEAPLDDLYTADPEDIEYDFSNTVNESGESFNDATIGVISEIAKSLKLNNEQANSLLRNAEPIYKRAQQEAVLNERKAWRRALIEDPEVGGENFRKTRAHLSTVMQKFGNNEVRDILTQTGLGDHPAFVKMFNAIGAALSPEVNVVKGTPSTPRNTLKDYYYNTKV